MRLNSRESRRTGGRDPWRRTPVGELSEQLLPRWFVVLGLIAVLAAVAALVAAFVVFGPEEVPVAARRPPPGGGLTTAVGAYQVGESPPVAYAQACPLLRGVRIAGEAVDQALLRRGLAAVCNAPPPAEAAAGLEQFARAGGVVRFAQFEATGVDSTAQLQEPPRVLVNAKFTRTTPLWIAPLIVHDVVAAAGDPALAETALAARRAEDAVCRRVLGGQRPSRGCTDAAELLALPDPLAALREAGYR